MASDPLSLLRLGFAALNLTSDRLTPVEWQHANLLVDRSFPAEAGLTAAQDAQTPIEESAAAAMEVAVDRTTPIEAGHGVAGDPPVRIEAVANSVSERPAAAEASAVLAPRDAPLPAASGTSVERDPPAPAEYAGTVLGDAQSPAEAGATARADRPAALESTGAQATARDTQAPVEILGTQQRDAAPPGESLATQAADRPSAIEFLLAARNDAGGLEVIAVLRTDGFVPAEESGTAVAVAHQQAPIESAAVAAAANSNAPAESGTALSIDRTGPAEAAATQIGGRQALVEALGTALRDGTLIEALGRLQSDRSALAEACELVLVDRQMPAEAGTGIAADRIAIVETLLMQPPRPQAGDQYAGVEWAAVFRADPQAMSGSAATASADTPLPQAWGRIVISDPISNTYLQIEALATAPSPLVVVDRGRLRPETPTLAQPRAFFPLAPGASDNFAFDFTADAEGATIVSAAWTCALRPLQTVTDPQPQLHILSQSAEARIATEMKGDFPDWSGPVVLMLEGAFAVASIGGFLPAQAGALYLLTATATMSDGRVLTLSADLPIRIS